MKTQAISSLKEERDCADPILLPETHADEEGGDGCRINFRF